MSEYEIREILSSNSLYKILKVTPQSDEAQIKKAYKKVS